MSEGVMRVDRVKQRRDLLQLTQQELGDRVGVTDQTIYRIEKGKHDPASKLLKRLAQELNVSADWLLGLVDEPGDHMIFDALSGSERRLLLAFRTNSVSGLMEAALKLAKQREGKDAAEQDASIND